MSITFSLTTDEDLFNKGTISSTHGRRRWADAPRWPFFYLILSSYFFLNSLFYGDIQYRTLFIQSGIASNTIPVFLNDAIIFSGDGIPTTCLGQFGFPDARSKKTFDKKT